MLGPSTARPRNFSDSFFSNETYAMLNVNTRKDKKMSIKTGDKRIFFIWKNNDL
jgi:hypothetical protein